MYVKCSEDSDRMKRPHSHLTPHFQRTPSNICINLILPETTFTGLHYCRRQYIGSSANFRTVLSESRWQILTQNDHSRSFKDIYFGIIEEPLMGYIAQYNKCGLRCEDSEDIASERSENLHFRPTHSHLTPPLQRTAREYPHKTYLSRN